MLSQLSMQSVFSKSLSAYGRNLRLVVPHAVEIILDLAALLLFILFLALGAVLYIPSLEFENIERLLFGEIPFGLIVLVLFSVLILFALLIFFRAAARAAVITMSLQCYREGQSSLRDGWEGAKKRGVGIFLYSLILACVFVLMFALGSIPLFLGSIWIGVFTLVLAALLSLVIYLFALFAPQMMVIGDKGIVDSMRLSYRFVDEHFGSVLIYVGAIILIYAGALLLSLALEVIKFISPGPTLKLAIGLFGQILSLVVGLLVDPYLEMTKTYVALEVYDGELAALDR